jgi:hypothetical protein
MARKGSESKMAKDEFQNQHTITQQKPRVSVFDRLGPKATSTSQNPPRRTLPEDEQFEIPARRGENNYPDRRHRGGAGGKQQQQHPPRERPRNAERETPVGSNTPQVRIKPNALLHRTLQDVKKERTKEAFVSNPAAAVEDLEQRLQRANDDLIAAEELSNALLMTQQTLLQDKAKLQAENMQLKREMEALQERLAYLDIGDGHGDCSPGPQHRGYASGDGLLAGEYGEYHEDDVLESYADEQHHYEAITPDSGMLKAIRMNAAAAAGAVEDGEDAVARLDLENLGDIKKNLEEEI